MIFPNIKDPDVLKSQHHKLPRGTMKNNFCKWWLILYKAPNVHSFFLFLFQKKRVPALQPWPLLVLTLTLRFIIHFLPFWLLLFLLRGRLEGLQGHTQTLLYVTVSFMEQSKGSPHPRKGRQARNEAKLQNAPHYPNRPRNQEMAIQVLAEDWSKERLNSGWVLGRCNMVTWGKRIRFLFFKRRTYSCLWLSGMQFHQPCP